MVDEVGHDCAHDQAGKQLGGTNAMEEESWVVTGRSLRASIKLHDGGRKGEICAPGVVGSEGVIEMKEKKGLWSVMGQKR